MEWQVVAIVSVWVFFFFKQRPAYDCSYVFGGSELVIRNSGMPARTRVMFGPPAHASVYFIYGMYYCCTAVSAPEGVGEAVLVRALEPLEGIDLMRARRGRQNPVELCSGPGKLAQAMGITRSHNGADLTNGPLFIFRGENLKGGIVTTTRIGIKAGAELPLRFYLAGSAFVSKK